MRDYEIVYIFDSALEESKIEEKLERFHGVASGNGGEITAVDHWGKRQLSYPIQKKPNGYFVVAQFQTDPEALPELERQLKLDDDLMRYLLVLNEGQPTSPMSIATRSGGAEDDDEYDDDDDDDEDEE